MNPEQERILKDILEAESHCCELTVAQLRIKKSTLLTNQPQRLMTVDRELLRLSQKTMQLEKQRQVFMSETGCSYQSLQELLPHLNAASRPHFQTLHHRLLRSVQDSRKLNQETQVLLKLSLHWVRDTLRIIHHALQPKGASYTAKGSCKSSDLDNQAGIALSLPSTISRSA